MKKLILNVDALKVETFEPETSGLGQSGSVAAYLASQFGGACPSPTYDRQDFACYASYVQPQAACTPVCGRTAQCVHTEDVCVG